MTDRSGSSEPVTPVVVECELPVGNAGLSLPASIALAELSPDLPLFHADLGRRHPLASYNVSIATVGHRGRALTSLIVRRRSVGRGGKSDKRFTGTVVEATDAFLDAVMEHLEDCERTIDSFFPKNKRGKGPIHGRYEREMLGFRDHMGLMVNHIKHRQGRLCLVEMSTPSAPVLGFFVEEARADGSVGPHVRLHNGGHTAYSFNRYLRYCAAEIIRASLAISDAVKTITGASASALFRPSSKADDFFVFLQMVAALPGVVFPDEVVEDWPSLTFQRAGNGKPRTFRLEYPAAAVHPTSYWLARFSALYSGDGVTRAFQIPYLAQEFWKELLGVPGIRGRLLPPRPSQTQASSPPG